jgi:prevent-host-death family protein
MRVSVSDAKGQLTELVRRAEAGDEVVLTRHGKAVARLVPLSKRPTQQEKRSILQNYLLPLPLRPPQVPMPPAARISSMTMKPGCRSDRGRHFGVDRGFAS